MLRSSMDRIQEYSSPVCSGVDSPGQGLGKAGLELGAGGTGRYKTRDEVELAKEHNGSTKHYFSLCCEVWPVHFSVQGWER